MKKQMAVRIGRPDIWIDEYQIGLPKMRFDNDTGFGGCQLASFCKKDFEKVTGFNLKIGEACLVKINVVRVKKPKKAKK